MGAWMTSSADRHDPRATAPISEWALTKEQQEVFDLGFFVGYRMRQEQIDQLEHDADRFYRAAYDRTGAPKRRRFG